MSTKYTGRRISGRPARRRRRRRSAAPLLLALILVLGAAAALHFTGVLKRPAKDPKPAQEQSDPTPDDPTPDDPTPDDPTPDDPTPDDPTPDDPTPDDPTPVEPVSYERIELKGDQKQYAAVYRIGDTGYEMYTYVSGGAEKYAQAVNKVAENLQGTANVYAVTVPLSSGITMPDELLGSRLFDDQKAAEEKIIAMLGDQVKAVPLYDALMRHRTEYVYFRTDHHWTGLGAYYGYRAFCQAKGITPHELTDYQTAEYTGFLGSFYSDIKKETGSSDELGANPDMVTAYFPVTNPPMTVTNQKGTTATYASVICNESTAPAANKYGAYIYGDNPYTVIENPEVADGACVVIKESFGNAMVPFLADHYHTVYVVDYRYWSGNLLNLVRENGVQDVVFINNLSAIRNSYRMGQINGIIG